MTAPPLRVDTRALVDTRGAGPVTQWPERLSLAFGILLFVAVVVWGRPDDGPVITTAHPSRNRGPSVP